MARSKVKKKIVFVCTGNTCRSPMAEYLFREKITRLGLTKLEISSVGLKANESDTINEKSAQILRAKGFDISNFHAKNITEKDLKESLAIVCMTDNQRDIVMDMRWAAMRKAGVQEVDNNVYSFSDSVGYSIIDPYGHDLDCYAYVFGLLEGGMSAIIDKILPLDIRQEYVTKPRKPRETKPKAENLSDEVEQLRII